MITWLRDVVSKKVNRWLTLTQRKFQREAIPLYHEFGPQIKGILTFPIKIVLLPISIPLGIIGSAHRGFGVPEFVTNLSAISVVAVITLGTCDIAFDMGKKLVCPRNCQTCCGWRALRCTMCRGTGKVHYQVKNYTLNSGEKATAGSIADAVVENRAELVHLPSTFDLDVPLPLKDCPTCDGTGTMQCPECKNKLGVRISADNIMEPPWKAYNVLRKMDYPFEHIVHSMKDPSIAAFWLITMPQIVGGFKYNDEIKQKIWWRYKDSMRYDQLRDEVAQRKPGWEYLQEGLVALDPVRARDDPVVVKNVPYFKAKKALELEVMKLDPPSRPKNWGDLNLPLDSSFWSEKDLKDPKKMNEMKVLLNAQRELAEQILDAQWEAQWRQDKLNEILEEKAKPYIQNINNIVLPEPIIIPPQPEKICIPISSTCNNALCSKDPKVELLVINHGFKYQYVKPMCQKRRRRWWFF